ncbi:MAG: hypothetical protein GSR74_00915 [Desulfurococcales archaeon]|nr:hypothetical protein [Desulfurococcales archaeon]
MSGIEEFTQAKKAKGQVIYKPIHTLYARPSSECEFFRVVEEGGSYMAMCMVLGRYLTRDEVVKCENYWKTCPYRKIGKRMMEESNP